MNENSADLLSLSLINQYVRALSSRDIPSMQKLRSVDFVLDWVHNDASANNPVTEDDVNQFWSVWFAAFPEMDYEVTRTIAGEDVVVTQWTFMGIHSGSLGNPVLPKTIKPTGKAIRLRGISVYDIDSALINKETIYIDLATLYVELGVT